LIGLPQTYDPAHRPSVDLPVGVNTDHQSAAYRSIGSNSQFTIVVSIIIFFHAGRAKQQAANSNFRPCLREFTASFASLHANSMTTPFAIDVSGRFRDAHVKGGLRVHLWD
jgi:hypothetical protein